MTNQSTPNCLFTKAELEAKFGRTLTDEQYAFIERECEPDTSDYDYEDDNEPAFIDYLQDLVLNVEYWSSKFVPRSK